MTQTKDHPAAIRAAAQALAAAIAEGRAAGFAVAWPSGPAGLDAIAVSETGRARTDVAIRADEVVLRLEVDTGRAQQVIEAARKDLGTRQARG